MEEWGQSIVALWKQMEHVVHVQESVRDEVYTSNNVDGVLYTLI